MTTLRFYIIFTYDEGICLVCAMVHSWVDAHACSCWPHFLTVRRPRRRCFRGCFLLRVRELLAVKLLVDECLPFDFFSSGTTWTALMAALTAGTTPFPELRPGRVKHLLVEMFVATKKVGVVFLAWVHSSPPSLYYLLPRPCL